MLEVLTVLPCIAKYKQYAGTLLKLLQGLPLRSSAHRELQQLLALTHRLQQCVTDRCIGLGLGFIRLKLGLTCDRLVVNCNACCSSSSCWC